MVSLVEVAATALYSVLRNRKFKPGSLQSSSFPLLPVHVACILAIILILTFKGHKRFVHRLTLYLMVAALLEAVVSILDLIPVYHNGTVVAVREGFEDFCAAIGFLFEVTMWMPILVMCWIVLYLVMVLVFNHSANAIRWKHEVCGLAVVLILPLSITWVPFVKDKYGLSQAQCWIKASESNCTYDYIGLTFMFVFSYMVQFSLLSWQPSSHLAPY